MAAQPMAQLISNLRDRWNRQREQFTCWLNPAYGRFLEIQLLNFKLQDTVNLHTKEASRLQAALCNLQQLEGQSRLNAESYAHDLVEAEAQNQTMESENSELRKRVSTQDTLIHNLQSSALIADARATSAEARADRYHTELLGALKTEANWLASGLANRTIHPDAPIPDRPQAPSYRNADGTPMELPGRGVRIGRAMKRENAKVEEIIGKGRADFEKWAADHESEFYNSEALTAEDQESPLERLRKVMGEA